MMDIKHIAKVREMLKRCNRLEFYKFLYFNCFLISYPPPTTHIHLFMRVFIIVNKHAYLDVVRTGYQSRGPEPVRATAGKAVYPYRLPSGRPLPTVQPIGKNS